MCLLFLEVILGALVCCIAKQREERTVRSGLAGKLKKRRA